MQLDEYAKNLMCFVLHGKLLNEILYIIYPVFDNY